MSSALLVVAPNGFGSAAARVGDEAADLVRLAVVELVDALPGSAGMAGSDSGGAAWGKAYDTTVGEVLLAATDLTSSCYRCAALLEQTGLNYAAADAESAGRSAPVAAARWVVRHAPSFPSPPSAVGAGIAAPPGWSLVAHFVGVLWPDGHQDRLHHAAAAWRLFAEQLSGVPDYVDRAIADVRAQQVPEAGAAATVLALVRAQVTRLAAVAFALARDCIAYAHHLDQAHHAVIGQLTELLVTTAAIEAAGAAAAVFTLGASELAAQAEVLGLAERAAAAVRALIVDVVAAARSAATAIADLVTDALGVRAELVGILSREPRAAELARGMRMSTVPEQRLPGTVSVGPQAAALERLEVEASAPKSWHDPRTLQQHFDDHGPDFACTTPAEYAMKADKFIRRALRERLPMKYDRVEGVVRAYDPKTNTFGSYTLKGTRTKTFFKPRGEIAYWRRQPGVLR